uniref:protein-serine/threonine phosphatase n=1 Tax=Sinocyclocheilus grahami TaxID=75366 RepID=A0A672L8A1_SINGR
MGAYLSQPNTEKATGSGGNKSMNFGFAAMQGWRVSMEDAHNCIPELDDETAMFAVYDGHGGELGSYDAISKICKVAKTKVSNPQRFDNEEAALLHEEATMTIEELLGRFRQNQNKNAKKPCPGASKESEDGEKSHAEKAINGETGSRASETDSNGKEKAGGAGDAAGGSKMRACRRAAASGGSSGSSDGSAEKSGDAGPSCSSSAAPAPGSAKSKFFEDSEESEEGEDEEDGSEEEVRRQIQKPGSDSGTTAVVALIRGKQLIVANAGDSRCVVSEKGKAVDMSYDHKPEDELELTRIKNAGGKVTMDGRVNGGLNLSRAIGDHFYKRNKALPPEEQMISSLPDVKVLTLNEDHEFMVVACDGIWNVMSSQEVVDFVNERLKTEAGKNRPLSAIIEELLDHCLAPDTSGDGTGCDNMTCIIISFSPNLGSNMGESTKKRKPEESTAEENGNDSKKSKTE